MKFLATLLLVAIAAQANAQTIDVWDFINGNVVSPFLTDVTTGTLSVFQNLLNGLIASIGKRQTIDVWDFINGNVVSPFLTDVTTGTLSVFQNLLTSLIGSIGKRQTIDVWDFINGNVVSPFLTDVTTGTLSVFQNLLNGLIASIGKRQTIDVWDFLNGNVVSPFLTDVTTGTLSVLQNFLNSLIGTIGKRGLVLAQFQAAADLFSSEIQAIFSHLLTSLKDIYGHVASLIGLNRSRSHIKAERLIADTKMEIEAAVEKLAQFFEAWDNKRDLASLWSGLTGALQSSVDTLSSSLGSYAQSLYTAVQPHLSDFTDQMINHSLTAATSLIQTLANISGSLGK